MVISKIYVKAGCHLCDDARDVLACLPLQAAVEEIDIAGDAALMARYGTRIPVLAWDTGAELDWPFGVADLINNSE